MSTRKYGIIAQAVLLAVFAALLAAGSVYDGLIAEKLYTGKGIITVTTEAIGKMPLFLAAAFACAVMALITAFSAIIAVFTIKERTGGLLFIPVVVWHTAVLVMLLGAL